MFPDSSLFYERSSFGQALSSEGVIIKVVFFTDFENQFSKIDYPFSQSCIEKYSVWGSLALTFKDSNS